MMIIAWSCEEFKIKLNRNYLNGEFNEITSFKKNGLYSQITALVNNIQKCIDVTFNSV